MHYANPLLLLCHIFYFLSGNRTSSFYFGIFTVFLLTALLIFFAPLLPFDKFISFFPQCSRALCICISHFGAYAASMDRWVRSSSCY